jgi:hypothetical protein
MLCHHSTGGPLEGYCSLHLLHATLKSIKIRIHELKGYRKRQIERVVSSLLRVRIVKPAETPVAKQWLSSRQVLATRDTHSTMKELLEVVFSVRPVPRVYNEDQLPFDCRVQYLHRDPASRRRRRKGKSQI